MPGGEAFKCPSCGASLVEQIGSAATVACRFCGTHVVVPESLRPPDKTARAVESFASVIKEVARESAARQAAAPPPPTRSSGSPVAGCLVAAVIGGLIFGIPTWRAFQQEKKDQQKHDVPAPLFERPLEASLPREARYAGVTFRVQKGLITNRIPSSDAQKLRTSSKEAYATLQVSLQNPQVDRTQISDSLRLQLGDGRVSSPPDGSQIEMDGQSSRDAAFRFTVPFNATWKGANLLLGAPNREPAELPLDGDAPTPAQPVTLNVSGEARVTSSSTEDATYRLLSGTLDLDSHGKRADAGKRFLSLKVRVTNNSTFGGGLGMGDDNFRILADGTAIAPDNFINEVQSAQTDKEYEVVFMIPATMTQADLQVGPLSRQNAHLPLSLR